MQSGLCSTVRTYRTGMVYFQETNDTKTGRSFAPILDISQCSPLHPWSMLHFSCSCFQGVVATLRLAILPETLTYEKYYLTSFTCPNYNLFQSKFCWVKPLLGTKWIWDQMIANIRIALAYSGKIEFPVLDHALWIKICAYKSS